MSKYTQLICLVIFIYSSVSFIQAGKANIRISTDRISKRVAGGMHDKLFVHVKHEDEEELEHEVRILKTLPAVTQSGQTFDEEPENDRAYSGMGGNIVLVEKDGNDYQVKRAFLDGVEYNRNDDGEMGYSTTLKDKMQNFETQIEERAKRNADRFLLFLDLALISDYTDFELFKSIYGPNIVYDKMRVFYTSVYESMFQMFRYGLKLKSGKRIWTGITQLRIINSPEAQVVKSLSNEYGNWISQQIESGSLAISDSYIFFSQLKSVPGIVASQAGSVCTNDSVSVIFSNRHLSLAYIISTAVGHSLGAAFDTDKPGCEASKYFIMSLNNPQIEAVTSNFWEFSPCSRKDIEETIKTKTCLQTRRKRTLIRARNRLFLNKNEQCVNAFNNESRFCQAEQLAAGIKNICKGMICSTSDGGCSSPNLVPVDLTSCIFPPDQFHVCRSGICIFNQIHCERVRIGNGYCNGLNRENKIICKKEQARICREEINTLNN